jgi:hypothetical protein
MNFNWTCRCNKQLKNSLGSVAVIYYVSTENRGVFSFTSFEKSMFNRIFEWKKKLSIRIMPHWPHFHIHKLTCGLKREHNLRKKAQNEEIH